MSLIGQQSSTQTLRLVDRNRLIAQRVRVKPEEKLISKTTDTSMPQQNMLDNLWDLSSDFDFNTNSNTDVLLDLSNTQMSAFFREFSDDQDPWKEEQITASNHKTIKELGFYLCDLCPFLCLNVKLFLEHKEKDHSHHSPPKSLLRTKCIGCNNIFYSVNVLRVSMHTYFNLFFCSHNRYVHFSHRLIISYISL